MPTDKVVRGTLETLAANLAKAGVKIDRTSPLLPDFAASSAALHADADVVPRRVLCRRKSMPARRQPRAALPAERHQPRRRAAARHGAEPSRLADGRRRPRAGCARNGASCSRPIDAVICPIMPTPAYPHDHSADQEKPPYQDRRQGLCLSRSALLARHRHAARPALDRDPDRLFAGWTAGRRADRRPLAGGPHALEAGRTDRARIRRLQAAADV